MERYKNITFELPTIRMIAGATEQWIFNLYTPQGHLFDAQECSAACAIMPFGASKSNSSAVARGISECRIVEGEATEPGVKSALRVNFHPEDTLDLWGKFTYQITILSGKRTRWGQVDIPLHGILYIGKNIEPSPITKHNFDSAQIQN